MSGNVGRALEEWVNGLPRGDDGDIGMLGDWIAVVCMVAVDDEGQPRAEYYLAMKDGALLPHIAQGLLAEGMDQLERRTVGGED